jgi:hypothetical protein
MNRKPSRWLILMLALLNLVALTHCGRPKQAASQETPFSALARWVPGDAEYAMFFDLKPSGKAGDHWARIRQQLAANPTGQQFLDGMDHQFRVAEYGLDASIVGPVVNWYNYRTEYVISQLSDEEATQDAMLQHFEDLTWQQEEYEGQTLYHERNPDSWQRRERLAWTVGDGRLFLVARYDGEALEQLQALLSLDQEESLAALPAWQTVRDRLPETPLGLMFINNAAQASQRPPASDDTSLGTALNRQLVAMAWAAVPEEQGLRVEMAGTIAPQPDAIPELQALLNLPAVDPNAWPGLPAETAVALIGHDFSLLWPLIADIFNLDALTQLGDAAGLDLEADLANAGGPLTGDFALAITPPLPGQPISQGLPAGQLLILGPGAPQARVAEVQAAIEDRGAVFGPGEVGGVPLQVQAGTELTGYAIAYGFDDDILLFGSSPTVIGQGIAARRKGNGLAADATYRAALAILPDAPTFVVYIDTQLLTSTARTNMTEEQYQSSEEIVGLEAFEAIALGVQLKSDGAIDGVTYFFVGHD